MMRSYKFEEPVCRQSWRSPLGVLSVACSDKGVRSVALGKPETDRKSTVDGRATVLAKQAIAEMQEYVAGERKRFTVPLDLRGTEFQMKVWKALLRIPYGETRSYQQIAREVGNPRASRAVGMANHYNPVAIVVPCHRVVASDGSLGGYAGGLKLKEKILELERTYAAS
jgi:methylated-DNA-[protein]-cysteine S-methyltransferase